ncbi:hypothetical protein ANO11243_061700 [Dothideomycetidae sp. 11243]|nr:hypothetical protein ANO11243_061700 [fungal sp. No.11243]
MSTESKTETYLSENFVESAGAILFRLSTCEICILRQSSRHEYLLPKGRHSVGETRHETAIRETVEETGMPCRLLPVDLPSRLCPSIELGHVPDEVRVHKSACEPFAVQHRLHDAGHMKIIW